MPAVRLSRAVSSVVNQEEKWAAFPGSCALTLGTKSESILL